MRTEYQIAYEAGGYRERYAMEHGKGELKRNPSNLNTLWVFTYSADDPYQDANGATWDFVERRWVN